MRHSSLAQLFSLRTAPRIPLRLLLVIPFLIQMVGIVAVIGWFSMHNRQQAVGHLTQQLRSETTQRVEHEVNELLATATQISDLTAKSIAADNLTLADVRSLEKLYWIYLTTFPHVNGLGVGNTQGELMGLFRQPAGQQRGAGEIRDWDTFYLEYTDVQAVGQYISVEYTPQREAIETRVFARAVDARERPWYQAAAHGSTAVWTEVYPSISRSTEQALLINLSRPIFDAEQQLQGVINVILDLGQLSDFLSEIQLSESGQIFILEPSGELVAAADGYLPIALVDGEIERLSAIASPTPLVRDTAAHLLTHYEQDLSQIQQATQLDFLLAGERQYLQVTPFRDPRGLNWLMVVVMPERDFMSQIYAENQQVLLLRFGILGIAIALTVIISYWVTHPIDRLSQKALRLASGQFGQEMATDHFVQEVSLLARSFNRMEHNLQASFQILQERESQLRMALEAAQLVCWVTDLHTGQIECFGRHHSRGWTADQWATTQVEIAKGIHPEDRKRIAQQTAEAIQNQSDIDLEHRVIFPDGTIIWILALGRVITNAEGQPCKIVGISINITERKDHEAEREQLVRDLAQVNQELEQANLKLASYSQTLEQQVEARTAALQAAQEQIIAQEKLASLGTLAAGVAHELRNPLNFVKNYAEGSIELGEELSTLLQSTVNTNGMRLPSEQTELIHTLMHELQENTHRIHHHCQRATQVIENMMQHAHLDSERATPQVIHLHDLLNQALNLAYHSKQAQEESAFNPAIHKDYAAQLAPVCAIASHLLRALINLIDNAYDAMHEKYRQSQARSSPSILAYIPTLAISTHQHPTTVEIRIWDNGCGIDPAIRSQIFDPFFTTKPPGQGTGLGLSLSHDIIVKQHRGHLQIKSEFGQFTEITLTLPRYSPTPQSQLMSTVQD